MRLNKYMVLLLLVFFPIISFAQNPSHLNWREIETENFRLYYPEGQELTAGKSLEIAEKVHEPLARIYGAPSGKVTIVIRDQEDIGNSYASFLENKIEIWATWIDFEFRSHSDYLWNVVTHELTHIYSLRNSMKSTPRIPMAFYQHIGYQDEKREDILIGYPNTIISYPIPFFNIPRWLSEGIAQYQADGARFDRWDTHRDMILRQVVLNDNMLTLDQLSFRIWNGKGNEMEMVYNHGFAFVKYIAETYGEESLGLIMEAMKSTTSLTPNAAFLKVFNVSQNELYNSWKEYLEEKYHSVVESIGEPVDGTVFRNSGYINSFPEWSSDGSMLAYVSNSGQEYHILSCRIANFSPGGWDWKGKEKDVRNLNSKIKKISSHEDDEQVENEIEKLAGAFDISLAGGIQSNPVWYDSETIIFNRRMPSDRYGSNWWDIYKYTIDDNDPRKGEQERLTRSLRGTYPSLSPDRKTLAFVRNGQGLNNLFLMDMESLELKQLTYFQDGTQIHRPQWSPSGKRIAFSVLRSDSLDIALISSNGGDIEYLVSSDWQDRDPSWSSDGSSIYFSSDPDGIANIYRMDLSDGNVSKITNVIGGAFSPAPSPMDTTLAFSYYGAEGYEIRLMAMSPGIPVKNPEKFRKKTFLCSSSAISDISDLILSSKPYEQRSLDFSFMPLIRNDRGNLKFGIYALKSDAVDLGSFTFMGAISPANKDTDLYARFEYKRLIPTLFVELYRQTRSVDRTEDYMEEFGTIIKKRIYDLNEINFGTEYTYNNRHNFETRLIYSQYNARVHYTHFLTGPIVYKPYYTYSRGFNLSGKYWYNSRIFARDDLINPRGGRSVSLSLDRFVNFFLVDFEYSGFMREKYKKYPYNRLYVNWVERLPVPRTQKHTLLLRGQVNMIDRHVNEFYEERLGGPEQMRGYSYYSLSGRKTLMAQAMWRFPILTNIDKSYASWCLNHIYGGVFTGAGKAWNERELNWSTKGFKRDVGAELRVDALSFFDFPTMIEFSCAYGLDDVWIRIFDENESRIVLERDKTSPWKFYFSILFGFN